jgi:hypothetical protein
MVIDLDQIACFDSAPISIRNDNHGRVRCIKLIPQDAPQTDDRIKARSNDSRGSRAIVNGLQKYTASRA